MNDTSENHDQAMLDSLHNLVNGKSFIVKHLLNEFLDDVMTNGPVCIDERQKKGATTANINCYVNRSNTNQKTLILDCDGEDLNISFNFLERAITQHMFGHQ